MNLWRAVRDALANHEVSSWITHWLIVIVVLTAAELWVGAYYASLVGVLMWGIFYGRETVHRHEHRLRGEPWLLDGAMDMMGPTVGMIVGVWIAVG
jgi:hypothetical protein